MPVIFLRRVILLYGLAVLAPSVEAGVVVYNVHGVFDSNAATNVPFTAPNTAVHYSFSLDNSTAVDEMDPNNNVIVFPLTTVSYTLDGHATQSFTAYPGLINNPGTNSVLGLIVSSNTSSNGIQLNLNLPGVALFTGSPASPTLSLFQQPAGSQGFYDSERFIVSSATAVPEPSSFAFLSLVGSLIGVVYKRKVVLTS